MKGIITIAGYGTRFLPASKAIPKEMIPIGGIPLIQHHVEDLVAAGIEEIIVIVRAGSEAVQQHFAPNPALEQHLQKQGKLDYLEEVRRISRLADIVFVRQSETLPYGNASPALAARPWLDPGEPFYYMFGDDLIVGDVPVPQQILEAFREVEPAAVVAAQAVPAEETHLYGMVKLQPGSEDQVSGIVEKPEQWDYPSSLAQIGHFVFTPALFDALAGQEVGRGGELWLAEAVDWLAKRSKVIAQPIDGLWMAAGDPLRHLKACIELTLRQEKTREDLVRYLKSLEL
jgi:UTP--glucose-1-phosphate uridylyltransferase